ncbi:MAG: NfeD family protein [Gammaproteobacteria bacterium]|nr:NfeD family protein [Gammaproteobacteria bacterium]
MSHWSWLILALLLVMLEVFVPSTFFLWMGVAAGLVAALLWLLPDLSWQAQWLLFGLFSLLSLTFWFRFAKKVPLQSDEPLLNQRAQQQVGKVLVLQEAIVNRRGKVRIGDSVWLVEGDDRAAGEQVTVLSVQGSILKVE